MTEEPKEAPTLTPENRPSPRDSMALPGMLAISLYLLVLAGVLILGVVGGHYPALFLALAAAFLTASAGLILLLRWAWAAALAAVFLLACYTLWIFGSLHTAPALVQGALTLVFFLYLVRSEVVTKLAPERCYHQEACKRWLDEFLSSAVNKTRSFARAVPTMSLSVGSFGNCSASSAAFTTTARCTGRTIKSFSISARNLLMGA